MYYTTASGTGDVFARALILYAYFDAIYRMEYSLIYGLATLLVRTTAGSDSRSRSRDQVGGDRAHVLARMCVIVRGGT